MRVSSDVDFYRRLIRSKGFRGEEVEPLVHKVILIAEIKEIIKNNNWTQEEAAKNLRVGQPRVAELNRVSVDKFSTDLLIRYLYRLKRVVDIVVRDPAQAAKTSSDSMVG